MKASIIINNLPTAVTSEQVKKFLKEAGENYTHYDNEQYPTCKGAGMRERVILIHNNAKAFYSTNIELGRVFAFTQDEADIEFEKRQRMLNS